MQTLDIDLRGSLGRLDEAFEARQLPGELLIGGPAGTGKTWGILLCLHLLSLAVPNLRILICRKTRESLTQSALVTYEQEILPTTGHQWIAERAQRRVRQSYQYPNGTEWVVGGLDKPSKILSTSYDIAYPNEAIELTVADWETLSTRIGRPDRSHGLNCLLGDTNPGPAGHWLKKRCDSGVCEYWPSRLVDNPGLHDGTGWTDAGLRFLARLDKLSGARKQRLRFGRWASAEGQVYEGWEEAVHLIDPFPIPYHWRRVRSIDFGYTNPFVCQWWALDPDGRMHLYREIYRSRRTVRAHAADIRRHSAGETIEATVADHDAEDRATLREEGIETDPAWKAITPGIEAVQSRMLIAGDGRPRLFVHRGATVERDPILDEQHLPCSTAEEMDSYVYPPRREGHNVKEHPVDKDNHGADSMRYGTAYFDGLGSAGPGSWGVDPLGY